MLKTDSIVEGLSPANKTDAPPLDFLNIESVNAGHFVKQKKGQIFCSGCFSLVNRGFFEFSFAQMSSPTSQDDK